MTDFKPIVLADFKAERFWSKVKKLPGRNACWLWTGKPSTGGYGRFTIKNSKFIASRVAFVLSGGVIPHGLDVLHKCDNTLCVRPKHLFTGTHQDNMRDMASKGRAGLPVPYVVTQDLGLVKR